MQLGSTWRTVSSSVPQQGHKGDILTLPASTIVDEKTLMNL